MFIVAEQTHDAKKIYDSIAELYVEFHKLPERTAIEQYTFFNCMLLKNELNLGKGARILDLACGDGHYTRKLRELFPECAYLCGLDISSTMIDIGKARENENKIGIDYVCADGKDVPAPKQPYDIVTAIFYLNYAQTHDELCIMIKGIFDQLKKGGTFYSMNDNACSKIEEFNCSVHKKYGFYRELIGSTLQDGATIKYTLYWDPDTPSSCVFYNYYFSPSTYEKLFKQCGFSSFQWVQAQCNPMIDNVAFFDDLVRLPHLIGIIAKK
jgi:ubiquinone/menaquinone biosynthesis C-methylase UbiE